MYHIEQIEEQTPKNNVIAATLNSSMQLNDNVKSITFCESCDMLLVNCVDGRKVRWCKELCEKHPKNCWMNWPLCRQVFYKYSKFFIGVILIIYITKTQRKL